MGSGDWRAASKKIVRADRALSSAQDVLGELLAMDPSPQNRSRFNQAYSAVERARLALYGVRLR